MLNKLKEKLNIVRDKKWRGVIFIVFMLAVGWFLHQTNGVQAAWWNDDWHYRKAIIVNHDKVVGDLKDFPLLVSIADADLAARARADGQDIVFTGNGGGVLKFEIESYASTTGELVAWVKIPALSSTADTALFMYYGNAGASDLSDSAGVWDENYKGVWHLGEGTSTAADFYKDSTRNGNHGQLTDADSDTAQATSTLGGYAVDFNGDADYITLTSNNLNPENFTISAWVQDDDGGSGGSRGYISKLAWGTDPENYKGYALQNLYTDLKYTLAVGDTGDSEVRTLSNASSDTLWHYIIGTYDGSVTHLFVDGTEQTDSDSVTIEHTSANARIGLYYADVTSNFYLDGKVDEARISSTVRSADWIQTEYNNQASTTEFISTQDEEVGPGAVGYWTFDEGYGSTAHDLTANRNDGTINGAEWAEEQMCQKGKCLFFSDDYIEMPDDDSLDISGNITIEAWVKPLVVSGSQTIVYKSGAASQDTSTTTVIYRSVGNEREIASSTDASITLTISGSTAVFSAPLPAVVGVGDVIQYDANGDSQITAADDVVFVYGRSSSTEYRVKSATGSPPHKSVSGDMDWSIYKAYKYLNRAESGDENDNLDDDVEDFDTGNRDMAANNEQWNWACYSVDSTGEWYGGSVSIDWTTGPDNYLRIYTPTSTDEVGITQRHNGYYDTSKYRRVQTENSTTIYFTAPANHVRIDGLQLVTDGTVTSGLRAIYANGLDADADVRVSNNLIYGDNISGANLTRLLQFYDNTAGGQYKIWNNIIVNGGDGTNDTMGFYVGGTGGGDYFVYNNTFFNHRTGVYVPSGLAGKVVLKNNISIKNTLDDYDLGDMLDSVNSTNNASRDGTAPANGAITLPDEATTSLFMVGADAVDKIDFRLASGTLLSHYIIASGTDLSADPDLAFSTDIQGQERGNFGGWDLGADEYHILPKTRIYRSSGVATSEIASSTEYGITLTIYGDVATFSSNTPANMGVGDVIQYDADGDSDIDSADGLAFVYKRISAFQYVVKSATGTLPKSVNADMDWDVYRAYDRLAEALDGSGNENPLLDDDLENFEDWAFSDGENLVAKELQWNIAVYADGADSVYSSVNSWTTAPEYYLRIFTPFLPTEVGERQRHEGRWDEDYAYCERTNDKCISVYNPYVRLEGLQLSLNNTDANTDSTISVVGYHARGGDIRYEDCIFRARGAGTGSSFGVGVNNNEVRARVKNSVFYGFNHSASSRAFYVGWGGWYTLINNTFYDCEEGVRVPGNDSWGQDFVLINNVFVNVNDPITNSESYINATSSTHNASSNGDLYGQNPITLSSTAATDYFISATDFHIDPTATYAGEIMATGSDARYYGQYPNQTDIDNEERPTGMDFAGQYSVGADQYFATPIYRSVGYNSTTALETGSGNELTIAGSLATFQNDLGDTVGVGDVIQYDIDGSGTITAADAVAFIHERVSAWEYVVKTATGSKPHEVSRDTDWSVFRAYTSLANWETGTENSGIDTDVSGFDTGNKDIEAANEQWNIACYADASHTGSVEISGWNTATSSYIRIFTPVSQNEVGTSQRHHGAYDTSAFYMYTTSNDYIIKTYNNTNVYIEGLQMFNNQTTAAGQGIDIDNSSAKPGEIRISDNIIRGGNDNTYFHRMIWYDHASAGSIARVYNNIVYDCGTNDNSHGIMNNETMYAYNNIIEGCKEGIHFASNPTLLKNNIALNNTYDYSGTGQMSGSTNNSGYSGVNGPGENYFDLSSNSAADYFISTSDFHIDSAATYAAEIMATGTDVSKDPYISLNTDIDQEQRTDGWLGADQQNVTTIYRSNGPSNTTALSSGSNTNVLTIENGVAAFVVDQPNRMGVGDIIQYDSDNDGDIDTNDSLAVIHGRVSARQYIVRDTEGRNIAKPVYGDRDWSVFRAYSRLAYAEKADENNGLDDDLEAFEDWVNGKDIAAANMQWNIACYADAVDSWYATVDEWTTESDNYLKIYTPYLRTEVGESQRHTGAWDDTKYRLEVTPSFDYFGNVYIRDEYVRVEGLQIKHTSDSTYNWTYGVRVTNQEGASDIHISENIIQGNVSGASAIGGIFVSDSQAAAKIWNNIIYNFDSTIGKGMWLRNNAGIYAYSNTIYNVGQYGIIGDTTDGTDVLKNNIVLNAGTRSYYANSISWHGDTTNNASYDGYAPDNNEITLSSDAATDYFVSATDFHINPNATNSTEILETGANLSADSDLAFSTDIDNQTRYGWDLGADEYSIDSTGSASLGNNYSLSLVNDELKFSWYNNGNYNSYSNGANIEPSRWSHVVYKRSGTSEYFYVDGRLVSQKTAASGLATTDGSLFIGARDASSSMPFSGWLDEVRVYPYARSQSEARATYAAGESGSASTRGIAASFGKTSDKWMSDGLVGYWKMDESATTSGAVDSSGNGNTGTYYGDASTTGGKFGNGGSFDGIDDYVDVGDPVTIQPAQLTISAWVYLDSTVSDLYPKVIDGDNDNYGYQIYYHLGVPGWSFGTGNGLSSDGIETSVDIKDQWVHIVGTHDAQNKNRIYINGALEGELNGSAIDYTNITTIRIGNRGNDARHWKGKIDEVRIYNRALSPAEVRHLYEWAPGPVAWWKFDEHEGQTAYDSVASTTSTGGNHGTLYNMATSTNGGWTQGKYGGALSFDGTDDWVEVGSSSDFDNTNSTWCAWFKSSTVDSHDPIFTRHDSNSTDGVNMFIHGTTHYLVWQAKDSAGTSVFTMNTDPATYDDSKWHHVCGISAPSGGTAYIYVDGTEKNSVVTTSAWSFNNQVIKIGDSIDSFWGNFDGLIDDVRIYNYARTQKQILEDMNAGHPAAKSPSLHLSFDEGYGATAHDSSIYQNNGSLQPGTGGTNTASSAMWSLEGKFGKAMEFDGTDDDVDLTFDGTEFASSSVTVSAWIYPRDLSASQDLFRIVDNEKAVSPWDGFSFYIAGSANYDTCNPGDICLFTSDGTVGGNHNNGVPHGMSVNNWYHVAVTFENDTKKAIWYIDGINKGSQTYDYVIGDNTDDEITVGSYSSAGFFDGLIDEVKIWNYVLTEDEIKTEYNQGQAAVMGAGSTATTTTGNMVPDWSKSRQYCVPGSTDYCATPVGEWKMDEKKGATAYDTSGHGNDGSLGGGTPSYYPAWSRGHHGNALDFDGTDDYIDAGTTADFPYDSFSITVWVKTSGDYWDTMLGNGGTNTSYPGYYFSAVINDGVGNFEARDQAGTIRTSGTYFTKSVADNAWHHLSVTIDRSQSTNNIKEYIDGVLDKTGSLGSSYDISGYGNLYIGRTRSWGSTVFKGLIDDLRIYKYVRTPAQIAWDYNRGKPIAYYKFDECQGGTIHDQSYNCQETGDCSHGQLYIGASGTTATGTCASSSDSFWYNGKTGKRNHAGSFDGSDDYVDCDSNASLDNLTSFAYSAWIYPEGWGENNSGTIIAKKYSATVPKVDFRLKNTGPTASLRGVVVENAGGNAESNAASSTISLNRWQHVLMTYNDDGDRKVHLYINGKEVNYSLQAAMSGTAKDDSAGDLIVGDGYNSERSFDGLIDEVKIYNYALTAEQIKMEYSGGAVRFGQ